MIHLLNEALNANNQHYYLAGSVTIFTNYFSSQDVQITEDNYRLNNNILRVGFTENFTLSTAINKHTVVHVLDSYQRVYNVINYEIQSGYIIYYLAVDLWHTYLPSANPQNLIVKKCTRNLGGGFYAIPNQPNEAPSFSNIPVYHGTTLITSGTNNEYIDISYLTLVLAIKYNTYESQSGAVSTVRLFGFNLKTLTDLLSSANGYPTVAQYIEDLVGGIYQENTYVPNVQTPSSTHKAEVVNAWIIENDGLTLEPQTYGDYEKKFVTHTSYTNLNDKELSCVSVVVGTKVRKLKYTTAPHKSFYVGTKYNNIPAINNYNTSPAQSEIEIHYITGYDTMRVLAVQGDNQVDITSAFSMGLTQVNGDISLQRQILDQMSNTLPIIASAGTIGVGVMTQNPVAIGGGILSMANSVTNYAKAQLPQHMGNIVRAGDALTTYFNSNTRCGLIAASALNPYFVISVNDTSTGGYELDYYGLNYDVKLSQLLALENTTLYPLVRTTVIDNNDYIQCSDLTLSGNIPKEAAEFIYAKLINGIRFSCIPTPTPST